MLGLVERQDVVGATLGQQHREPQRRVADRVDVANEPIEIVEPLAGAVLIVEEPDPFEPDAQPLTIVAGERQGLREHAERRVDLTAPTERLGLEPEELDLDVARDLQCMFEMGERVLERERLDVRPRRALEGGDDPFSRRGPTGRVQVVRHVDQPCGPLGLQCIGDAEVEPLAAGDRQLPDAGSGGSARVRTNSGPRRP